MKLSKRQLRRIIREEYNLLKRRGLIREGMNPEMMMDLEEFEDQLEMSCGERYQRGELSDALENDMFEGDGIYSCEMVLGVCTDPQLKREILKFCQMAVMGGGDMYEPESDMYESRRRRVSRRRITNRRRRSSRINEYGGGQNFDRELEEVEMMITACKAAGVPISYEEEKRYYESAYYVGHIDAELYEKYDQCQ